jgi:hypothetical protein
MRRAAHPRGLVNDVHWVGLGRSVPSLPDEPCAGLMPMGGFRGGCPREITSASPKRKPAFASASSAAVTGTCPVGHVPIKPG